MQLTLVTKINNVQVSLTSVIEVMNLLPVDQPYIGIPYIGNFLVVAPYCMQRQIMKQVRF